MTDHAFPDPENQQPFPDEPLTDMGGDAAPAGGVDASEGPTEEQLKTQLADAEQQMLRAMAELENYRKRTTRQMQDERRYANLDLLRDLLPSVDNLQRAVAAAEATPEPGSPAGLLAGVKIVASQLVSVLEKYHCTVIPAEGRPFDPHLHEAISQQPSDQYPPGTVLFVAQPGYRLHDRIVRPSQVIVSRAAEEVS